MQGIYKSTGYWQTQAARGDWQFMAKFASENGLEDAAKELAPHEKDGWRKIDKQIAKLRIVFQDHDIDAPPSPSNTADFEQWQTKYYKETAPDQQMRRAGMPTLPGLE